MRYTLGSLFDGSGGFPLAASMCGIEPVWASEIEPYPIAVTRSRFPGMKHMGDISKINGAEIEPVDIITFGSPCQDLSVAGKRAGLKHEANGDDETTRSGLFMEAVRIIKEMREATNGEYPTFAVWENVPGAFSSNSGEDFRTVLEELIKIVEPTAVMPTVPKNGWPYADSYCGDGWSLAYRVFDAQYWGVPQRRRRIYLVLDFRGERAGKVSFEREGLRENFATFKTAGKGTAGDATNRAGADDCEGAIPINTMIATRHKQLGRGTGFGVGEAGDPQFTISAGHEHAVAYTLKIRSGCDGGGKDALIQEDKSATLATNNDQYLFQPVNMVLDDQGGQQITVRTDGKVPTLRAETHGNLPCVLESAGFKAGQSMAGGIGYQEECAATLAAQCSGTEPTVCVKCYDARGNGDGQTVSTLTGDHENRITDYTSVVCMATQQGGAEIMENLCPTITASAGMSGNNQPMVCMAHGQANAEILEDVCPCLNCNHEQPIVFDKKVYGTYQNTGIGWWNESPVGATVRTPCGGDSTLANVCVEKNNTLYIVRRLTPTECARLQGFPDDWGHPDHKEDFTDEEYRFWLDVRNTHAAINGKPQKDYTKAQMLTWYNKLHTDFSEYKMYGNGIALPCALYVMQGIKEALIHDGMEIDNRIRK